MTAVLALRRRESITLLSDAASFFNPLVGNAVAPEPVIAEIGSKIRPIGPLAVIICRGKRLIGDWMETLGREVAEGRLHLFIQRFRQLCDALQAEGEKYFSPEVLANPQWREAEIVVAGWHQGFNVPGAWLGTMANRRMELMSGIQMVGLPPNVPSAAYVPQDLKWQEESNGVELFLRMRAGGGSIGGFIEKTVIDREGVTRNIIHRWPEDKPE